MLNVDDFELAESLRLANVCVRSNFSNASNDAADEEEEEADDDVIVCSFDCELSRLSREISFVENAMLSDASGQRLQVNEQ